MFRFHHVCNALQRLNSVVQLTHYKRYYNVYRFLVFEHKNFYVSVLYAPMCIICVRIRNFQSLLRLEQPTAYVYGFLRGFARKATYWV